MPTTTPLEQVNRNTDDALYSGHSSFGSKRTHTSGGHAANKQTMRLGQNTKQTKKTGSERSPQTYPVVNAKENGALGGFKGDRVCEAQDHANQEQPDHRWQ